MAWKAVDMAQYPRRAHFAYFAAMQYPYVGVTQETDETELLAACRERQRSFYLSFLHAAALAYAVPLGLFLAGLLLGYRWLGGEGAAILTGLLGLALGMLFLRLKDRTLAGRPEWTPHITAVYEDRSAVDVLGCPGREGL